MSRLVRGDLEFDFVTTRRKFTTFNEEIWENQRIIMTNKVFPHMLVIKNFSFGFKRHFDGGIFFETVTLNYGNEYDVMFLVPLEINRSIFELVDNLNSKKIDVSNILNTQSTVRVNNFIMPKFCENFSPGTEEGEIGICFGRNGFVRSVGKVEEEESRFKEFDGNGSGYEINKPFVCLILEKSTSKILWIGDVTHPHNPYKSKAQRKYFWWRATSKGFSVSKRRTWKRRARKWQRHTRGKRLRGRVRKKGRKRRGRKRRGRKRRKGRRRR